MAASVISRSRGFGESLVAREHLGQQFGVGLLRHGVPPVLTPHQTRRR